MWNRRKVGDVKYTVGSVTCCVVTSERKIENLNQKRQTQLCGNTVIQIRKFLEFHNATHRIRGLNIFKCHFIFA